MLDPQALTKRISSQLKSALKRAEAKQGHILSITIQIQEIRLDSLPSMEGGWFFWDQPSSDETILGLGNAVRLTMSGPGRFEILNKKMQEIQENWEWLDLESTGFWPISYLCFAFDPDDPMTGAWSDLPNSGLFLPELTLQQKDNDCVASFSVNLKKYQNIESIHLRWMQLISKLTAALSQSYSPPGCMTTLTRIATSSDLSEWRQLVSDAKNSIASRAMEKVVPARHLRVEAERRFDPRRLMDTLNYLYPNSMLLASRIENKVFVSATPERLIDFHNGKITCDAMAGTTHRSAVEEQDLELGKQLLSDPKVRHEHQLVVEGIKASLTPICSTLSHQDQPSLTRLRNLQHLSTEFNGQLKPDVTLLQAAARLHPTAAVNGYPGDVANLWLKKREPFVRGWYAGAAGWVDRGGNGKLAVLLRCALLDQDQADLFAGAGITAESNADAEYAETELKFRVMLEALENA